MKSAATLTLLALTLFSCTTPGTQPGVVSFSEESSCGVSRVVDGDTVTLSCADGSVARARLLGFDTPETFEPRCAAEAAKGTEATERLTELVAEAKAIELTNYRGRDRYDRMLVSLYVDGKDVGETLIAEGLARPYEGGPREGWCR